MKRAAVLIMGAVLVATLGLIVRPAAAQCCGDCNGDGAVTVDELIAAVNRALGDCADDGICGLESCPPQLAACREELADCRAQPGGQRFPASGQTTAYGPGSDGDVQAGATLSYTDNGDGTITDHNTGLVWEKKDDSGGIHDKDNSYTWGMIFPPYTMNGTMVTEFLATLNTPPCFAGHCDWRIPNVRELQSIADYETEESVAGPTVNVVFHNAAGCPGCADVRAASCSCTASSNSITSSTAFYWSSTTFRFTPGYAWGVFFDVGFVFDRGVKSTTAHVRAVRGGL
jgi:hypothetical protein